MTLRPSGLAAPLLALLLLPIPLGAQDPPEEAMDEVATEASETGTLEERIVREVEELHQFFQEWFNGAVENTDAVYERFTGVLNEDFAIVSPNGRLQPRALVIEGLRQAYAPEETLPVRVWVETIEIRRHWALPEGDLVLVTYEEWLQRGEAKRGRLSSALLRERQGTPNGVEWLHVHETWLPLTE